MHNKHVRMTYSRQIRATRDRRLSLAGASRRLALRLALIPGRLAADHRYLVLVVHSDYVAGARFDLVPAQLGRTLRRGLAKNKPSALACGPADALGLPGLDHRSSAWAIGEIRRASKHGRPAIVLHADRSWVVTERVRDDAGVQRQSDYREATNSDCPTPSAALTWRSLAIGPDIRRW